MVGKPALAVVTTDGGGSKQVYKYLKMTLSGWGLYIVGKLQVISPMYFENRTLKSAFGYDPYYFQKCNKNIKKISSKFMKSLKSTKKRVPSFYDIFIFNCLRSKTYTSKVDRTYWEQKGWIGKNYFYDVKLNPAKKAFGCMMKRIIHVAGVRYLQENNS